MPGKPSRERSKSRREAQRQEAVARQQAYVDAGGVVNCGTCYSGWRCPVDPSAVMPCWAWNGEDNA